MMRFVILALMVGLLGGCCWGPGWEGHHRGYGGSEGGGRDGYGGNYHHGAVDMQHDRSA